MDRRHRIAFASCNDQGRVNRLWRVIESRRPAGFVWHGDAVYADTRLPPDWSSWPHSRTECATPKRLKALYGLQKSVPAYRRLIEGDSNITVFGTFDDHDYGCNNGDSTFEHGRESGMAFVDFLGLPEGSAMRRRAYRGHGVYGVKLFDFSRPAGQEEVPDAEARIDPDVVGAPGDSTLTYSATHSVAVFVLDVRTNKSPWSKDRSKTDYEGDFLGERQWWWFENAIRNSRAAVNVVVNGLQVHANIIGDPNIAEAWGKFPSAQQRLYDALLQDGVESPVLISGDVHMTELSRKDCIPANGLAIETPRPLVEMTTSGMTHSWGGVNSPPRSDPKRKPTWKERYESFVASSMMHLHHRLGPRTDIVVAHDDQGTKTKSGLQYSLEKNFGELEFDFDARQVTLRSLGEDTEGEGPLFAATYSFDYLSGRSSSTDNGGGGGGGGRSLDRSQFQAFAALRNHSMHHHHGRAGGDWICLNHRGYDSPVSHVLGWTLVGFLLVGVVVPSPFIPVLAILCVLRRRLRRSLPNLQEKQEKQTGLHRQSVHYEVALCT